MKYNLYGHGFPAYENFYNSHSDLWSDFNKDNRSKPYNERVKLYAEYCTLHYFVKYDAQLYFIFVNNIITDGIIQFNSEEGHLLFLLEWA